MYTRQNWNVGILSYELDDCLCILSWYREHRYVDLCSVFLDRSVGVLDNDCCIPVRIEYIAGFH